MRKKEYFELANRSLRIRKKSNRSTVLGLAMGFALIVPIIVALFGVNVALTSQLNETPYALYYEIAMSDYRVDTDDYLDKSTLNTASVIRHVSGSSNIDYLTDNDSIDRAIVYEQYEINSWSDKFSLSINNGAFNTISGEVDSKYSIIDLDKSDSVFPSNLTENIESVFMDGYAQGFSNNGKQEIIVSEKFLQDRGISASDVYLKPITIKVSEMMELDASDTLVLTEGYICYDYIVVGIIDASVTAMYNQYTQDFMGSDLFFTSVNVYDSAGTPMLKPRFLHYGEKDSSRYIVYDNLAQKDELNKEYMMLGWGLPMLSGISENNLYTVGNTRVYVESDNYARLSKSLKEVNSYLSQKIGYMNDYAAASNIYNDYSLVYNLTSVVSLIILSISVVLGAGAFINMFCEISNSVRERRQYLTMMRAIGAKDKDIPRLYMLESVIISAKANILIIIIGFLLSMVVKLGFDAVLQRNNIVYRLSIPWWTIIVTIAVVVVAIFAVGMLFSYCCSKRLSKEKIVEILNDI